jgi:hypothetical protein
LVVEYQGITLKMAPNKSVFIKYNKQTRLPILPAFSNAVESAETLALSGSLLDEANQNLSWGMKWLLKMHVRLGHIGFSHLQWIGQQGWLGGIGQKLGKGKTVYPKCATCLFSKQERRPKPGKVIKIDKNVTGTLSKGKLQPGDLIFSDQYESSLGGRIYTDKGHPNHAFKYRGGTLFCDASSGYIYIANQITLSSTETISSTFKFEKEALSAGVEIKGYQTDNGIYTSKAFREKLSSQNQSLRLSAVGAHHQNGVAESSIKSTTYKARALLIHAALRWPGVSEKTLWPMALQHAVYLHNKTPRQDVGRSPEEL